MSDTGLEDTINVQPKKDEKQLKTTKKPTVTFQREAKIFAPMINPSEEDKDEETSASTSKDLKLSTVDGRLFKKPKDDIVSVNLGIVESSVAKDSERYDMAHKNRGVAMIFNHINFKTQEPRAGSAKDCQDLVETFERLGFEVRKVVDPSLNEITTMLQKLAKEDHTDSDCLVVVVMSHGESGMLFTYESRYTVETLWNPFTADKCPTLIGKPKLFFIQACRGTDIDNGVTIGHQTDSVEVFSIPTFADILIAYSSYNGFYSWRNGNDGSWFIQALCKELNLNGRRHDLLTIMTFVNRRVAIDYDSYNPKNKNRHKKKQIPCITSMLTRLVYFSETSL